VSERRRDGPEVAVVCVPDVPERHEMGKLPANVEVVLLPRQADPLPDLSRVELLVQPTGRGSLCWPSSER